MRTNREAFTLVEASIVIVIIGLLIGVIVVGTGMMRSQALRSVMADAKLYSTAIQQFSDKYGALPGDMADAERVFGNAEGGDVNTNCATPLTSATPDGTKTCNGDGNGVIILNAANNPEGFWAWQQLKAAGMIAGNYTGISGSGTNGAVPGRNIPNGAITGTGYYLYSWGTQVTSSNWYAGNYDNLMIYGTQLAGTWPYGAALRPTETFEIDQKADDGTPGTGSIRTFPKTWMTSNGVGTCVSSDDPTTATYVTTSTALGCLLLFTNTFDVKKQ